MEEHLAIASDRIESWRKKKIRQCFYDLKPREFESAKSTWAHILEDTGGNPSYLLSRRPSTSRMLHALSFLISREDRNPGARFYISGVSLHRSVFAPEDVTEDMGHHPVRGLDASHRSIQTNDQQKREAYALRITEEDRFCSWEYDLSELRDLLRFLVDHEEIHEHYRPAAQRLLDASIG
jgi:hypothetical protein